MTQNQSLLFKNCKSIHNYNAVANIYYDGLQSLLLQAIIEIDFFFLLFKYRCANLVGANIDNFHTPTH